MAPHHLLALARLCIPHTHCLVRAARHEAHAVLAVLAVPTHSDGPHLTLVSLQLEHHLARDHVYDFDSAIVTGRRKARAIREVGHSIHCSGVLIDLKLARLKLLALVGPRHEIGRPAVRRHRVYTLVRMARVDRHLLHGLHGVNVL